MQIKLCNGVLLLKKLTDSLERTEVLPVFVVIACIQGTVVVGQFVAATVLTPSQMGVIRSVETIIPILVLIGGSGTQALAIRDVAALSDMKSRGSVMQDIILIVFCGTTLVILGVILSRFFWGATAILELVTFGVGLVLLTNLVRVVAGFAHGAGLVANIYRHLFIYSIFVICGLVVLSKLYGVLGWIIGRYVGEIFLLVGLVHLLYKLGLPLNWKRSLHWPSIMLRARHGITINLALVIRLLVDSMPVLCLTVLKVPTDRMGQLGLAILALSSVMILLAVLAQRALPRMAALHSVKSVIDSNLKELLTYLIMTSVGGMVALGLFAWFALHYFSGSYTEAYRLTMILCIVLPFRAIALAYGTHLIVIQKYMVSVLVNLSEAVLVGLLCYILIPLYLTLGVACAVLAGAVLSALLMWIASLRIRMN